MGYILVKAEVTGRSRTGLVAEETPGQDKKSRNRYGTVVAMLAFITLPLRFFVVIDEASLVMFRSMERWKNAADTISWLSYKGGS